MEATKNQTFSNQRRPVSLEGETRGLMDSVIARCLLMAGYFGEGHIMFLRNKRRDVMTDHYFCSLCPSSALTLLRYATMRPLARCTSYLQ